MATHENGRVECGDGVYGRVSCIFFLGLPIFYVYHVDSDELLTRRYEWNEKYAQKLVLHSSVRHKSGVAYGCYGPSREREN